MYFTGSAGDFALHTVISSGVVRIKMLYNGRYGPAPRSTEIWAFLEVDFWCAAWFNSRYTLKRQSTFFPAVTCSVFTSRSTEFWFFWKLTFGAQLGSTVDARSRVSREVEIARFLRAGRPASPEENRLWTFLKDDFKNISTLPCI